MIKKIWNKIYDYAFCDVPPLQLTQASRDKCIRELLAALDGVDYANAMVEYRGKQIARYNSYINDPDAFISETCTSKCGNADFIQFPGITLSS